MRNLWLSFRGAAEEPPHFVFHDGAQRRECPSLIAAPTDAQPAAHSIPAILNAVLSTAPERAASESNGKWSARIPQPSQAKQLTPRATLRHYALALLLLLFTTVPAHARFEPVSCRNSFTEDAEIAEGNKVALAIYQQMPILPERDPLTRYVQTLGARLVAHAPLVQGVQRQWPFNFHVVASADINAFALPGGSIFVNLGTIQAAETEAQLAGVMAHEISHVVMRHSTCNMGKQRNKSLLYGLGALGSALLLGDTAAGQIAQAGIGYGQNLDFLHMSRGDEQQADLEGVNILDQAGYDPRGLPQFFETIKAKYGAGGAQFMSDHPNPGNRTEYVNAEIATLPPLANPIVSTPAFTSIHAVAIERKPLSAQEVKAGAWKRSGLYAAQPGGNGAILASTPVQTTTSQTSPSSTSPGSAATPPAIQTTAPLPRAAFRLNDPLTRIQATRYALQAPASWKRTDSADGTVTLAPPGGAGSFGVAYGLVTGIAKQDGNGVMDATTLASATTTLVSSFTQTSGLAQTGAAATLQVAGRAAQAITLRGTSPVADAGTQLPERDWLITIARPDGDLNYLVFVSPERDFATLKPLFDTILRTFLPQ